MEDHFLDMSGKKRVRYIVPGSEKKMRIINPHQTISEVIAMISRLDRVDIDELSLDGCVLPCNECFFAHFNSSDQVFVFSKSSERSRSANPNEVPSAAMSRSISDRSRIPPSASDQVQYATIGDQDPNPIRFDSFLFNSCSSRYFRQLQEDPLNRDLKFAASFKRDSIVQFLNLCQAGHPFNLTRANIFEVELLCREWEVKDKRVVNEVKSFIRNPPGGGTLTIGWLRFYLDRGLATADLEEEIRGRLGDLVENDELAQVPFGVLLRLVDFSLYLRDSESSNRVLNFCIRYFNVHGPESSQIFRTLNLPQLETEQLERLYRLQGVKWCWRDWSVVHSLIKDRRLVEQQDQEIAEQKALLRKLVLHPEQANADEVITRIFPGIQFPPRLKKGKIVVREEGEEEEEEIDVPDGIIAHLTRKCGGNVHKHEIVRVTSGSFAKEIRGASRHSGAYNNRLDCDAQNVADLEADSRFESAYREAKEDIPHTRNTWVCYNFNERRIVPTHYALRTYFGFAGDCHLKSWVVETSVDGDNWREVAREEDREQLNGSRFTSIFTVAGGGECRFIRLVNIGRNHHGSDQVMISAWEIFGNLIE
jgi:hypothetical protein